METKREIRQRIRQKRLEMQKEQWQEYSKNVTAAVISHPWFLEAEHIYTYVAYSQEVRTQEIIDAAFEMEKNVWVPKVMGEVMHFFHIRDMKELKPGAYGILEPVGDERDDEVLDEAVRDHCSLMIMPGVAFDETCRRVGYGGGYYDRYLAKRPRMRTIALAFEFQILLEIPCEEYDICPDLLITEKRMLQKR